MPSPTEHLAALEPAAVRRAALAGLSATLVGIGLARFAYTPIIPALIASGWFQQRAAAYLGAANLAGYLAGALLGRELGRRVGPARILRGMMLLTSATLAACSWRQPGFAWFFAWRFVSGFTGGSIMVLAAPTVLARTPPQQRGLVGGAVFTGIGLGVTASGTLVPLLLRLGGLVPTWLGLAGLALALTALSWSGWPAHGAPAALAPAPAGRRWPGLPVAALLACYSLNAVGVVPHMLFLVVFVARGLGRGLGAGAAYWVVYGVGTMVAPLMTGHIADLIGFRRALRLGLALQAAAVATAALATHPAALVASAAVVGGGTLGIAPIVVGRLHDLVPDAEAQRRGWAHATAAWALGQFASAYAYSYLLGRTGSYVLLFAVGTAALLAALLLDLLVGALSRREPARGTLR